MATKRPRTWRDNLVIATASVLLMALAAIIIAFFVATLTRGLSLKGLVATAAASAILAPFVWSLLKMIRARMQGQPLGNLIHANVIEQTTTAAPRDGLVEVSAKTDGNDLRCVYCHDSFDKRPVMLCPCCNVRLHPDCWAETGSCPTLGCEGNSTNVKKQSLSGLKDNA